jgi:hypothetical protein
MGARQVGLALLDVEQTMEEGAPIPMRRNRASTSFTDVPGKICVLVDAGFSAMLPQN